MDPKEEKSGENIVDRIREIFGKIPDHYSILEEQIDIDLQMEYFEQSKTAKEDLNHGHVMGNKDGIFDENLPEEDRKLLFTQLASVEDVEAYRTIENYLKSGSSVLKNWARLALQESRMLLESKFLDENQVFISTGLGGKDGKLRYFSVLIGKQEGGFSRLHMKIIRNEFEMCLKKNKSELEKIEFTENFALLMVILPLETPIRDVFRMAIENCNIYGNFLNTDFILTNVRELGLAEIKAYIRKKKQDGE